MNNCLYLSGESYAGKYLPATANKILQENAKSTPQMNLKGILVGDGWVYPRLQSTMYAKLAFALYPEAV